MFDAKRVLAAANVDPTKWQIPWNAPYAIYPSGLSESELATLSKTFVGGDLVQVSCAFRLLLELFSVLLLY